MGFLYMAVAVVDLLQLADIVPDGTEIGTFSIDPHTGP